MYDELYNMEEGELLFIGFNISISFWFHLTSRISSSEQLLLFNIHFLLWMAFSSKRICLSTSVLLHFITLVYIQTAGQSIRNLTMSSNSLHCSHPASIDNSLDWGIFIVTALKFLGFSWSPLIPLMPANLARVRGKEMASLGGKNLIKQIL